MDKELKRAIAAIRAKAKKDKWNPPHIKHEPSSLEKFIKTKEQADRLMRRLKELGDKD